MLFTGDIGRYLSGSPVPIPMCAIFIEQPSIKTIEMFGEDSFLTSVELFGNPEKIISQLDLDNTQLENIENFQIILEMIKSDQNISTEILDFFKIICPSYDVELKKNSIDFFQSGEKGKELKGQITAFSFDAFSTVIKELFLFIGEDNANGDYNVDPNNEKAMEIYKKIQEGKRKVNSQRGVSAKGGSLYGLYISILSVALPMDMNILFDYTPFQLIDTFKRYFAKVNSDFYQKVSTTPFMDVSKMEAPKEWTRSLYQFE